MKIADRKYGIDIVRIIAVLLVLVVHFFLNTRYYEIVGYGGFSIKLQSIIRNFSMICVPLFMLLTGFLNKKTEYNKSFFKGLFNIILIWFFYSLIEFLILTILNHNYSELNFINLIYKVTSFEACGYSWYIEMYIGLYLLSPIINNAYNSFNKKNKSYLLIIIISMIILPNFINVIFKDIIHLPDWWGGFYPIAYYICGKYVSENSFKIKKKTLIILILLIQIFILSFSYIVYIDYNNFLTFINAILVFLLFYDLNIKNKILQKVITYISSITLDIYLGSSLIDKLIYPIFNTKMDSMGVIEQNFIIYAPILLIFIFLICIIYGSIRKLIINNR